MEPSDEELGAFNQRECQRLQENRKEVGGVQDGILGPAHGGVELGGHSGPDQILV